MKEVLKKGDFLIYKLEDLKSINNVKEVFVEILDVANGENFNFKLLRLDNNETIKAKQLRYITDYDIIEVGYHHFLGLKSKMSVQFHLQPKSNEIELESEIKITELTINNLSFAHLYFRYIPYYKANKYEYGFYALKNQLKNEDYFNYFFEKKSNESILKNNLEKIVSINQLFAILDSVNYNYDKKEILLLKELEPKK